MAHYAVIIDGDVKTEIEANSVAEARTLMEPFYPGATYEEVTRLRVAVVREGVVENIFLADSLSTAADVITTQEGAQS